MQTAEAPHRNAEVPCPGGSAPKHGGSKVWQNSGTNRIKAPSQPRQQAPKASNTHLQVKENPIIQKRNKYAYKPMAYAPHESMSSSYVLRRNNLSKVVAMYVGNESNIYVKRSLWVSKILVANTQGPNAN